MHPLTMKRCATELDRLLPARSGFVLLVAASGPTGSKQIHFVSNCDPMSVDQVCAHFLAGRLSAAPPPAGGPPPAASTPS